MRSHTQSSARIIYLQLTKAFQAVSSDLLSGIVFSDGADESIGFSTVRFAALRTIIEREKLLHYLSANKTDVLLRLFENVATYQQAGITPNELDMVSRALTMSGVGLIPVGAPLPFSDLPALFSNDDQVVALFHYISDRLRVSTKITFRGPVPALDGLDVALRTIRMAGDDHVLSVNNNLPFKIEWRKLPDASFIWLVRYKDRIVLADTTPEANLAVVLAVIHALS